MTTQAKQAWTPGPWTHEDGEILAQGAVIAQVMGADDFPCCEEDIDAECKANARLISKAPEMAELLESFLVYLREFWPDEPLFSADQNTQAEVIAKAARLLAEIGGRG